MKAMLLFRLIENSKDSKNSISLSLAVIFFNSNLKDKNDLFQWTHLSEIVLIGLPVEQPVQSELTWRS
jgi:hypothetical protein